MLQGTIRQTSSLPCDTENTIHVALTLNRPLALACIPMITLTGLYGADCPDTDHLNISQSADLLDQSATWDRTAGTLVLRPLSDIVDAIDFSFTLVNPARGQSASAAITMAVTGTNYALSGFNLMESGLDVNLTLPQGLDANYSVLYVQEALITEAKIGQTSPFLCDMNVITLYLKSSAPLTHCKTIITVSGFAGMSSTTVPTFRSGNSIISSQHVKWIVTESGPTLVLDLMPLKSSSADTYTVAFNLTNPKTKPAADQGPINSITGCPMLSFSGTKQSCSAVVEVLHDATLEMVDDWLALAGIQNMHTDTTQELYDHHPMCLRKLQIDGTATQDNANPCLYTTRIHVTLTANVPLFPRCTPALTVSGLTGSCTETLEVRSSIAILGKENSTSTTWIATLLTEWSEVLDSEWDKDTGTLVLPTSNFAQVVPGGRELDFSFFLQRGASANDGVVDLTLTTSGMPLENPTMLTLPQDITRPMKVESIHIENGSSIAQSSTVPCSNASITVRFQLSKEIDTICTPRVTVTGARACPLFPSPLVFAVPFLGCCVSTSVFSYLLPRKNTRIEGQVDSNWHTFCPRYLSLSLSLSLSL